MTTSDASFSFEFYDSIPVALTIEPVLISGYESAELAGREYILQLQGEIPLNLFEIRYSTSGGPYKEAKLFGHFLVVGHYQYFYLYDLKQNMNVIRLEVNGYFGHLYQHETLLYLTDAGSLYCINKDGRMVWKNTSLGIDGNYISSFTQTEIHGRCQWDPPDGWEDYVLDKATGKKIG